MAVKNIKRTRKPEPVLDSVSVTSVDTVNSPIKKNNKFIWVGGVLGVLVLTGVVLYKTNNFPIVAMVGMKPITRYEINRELFKQSGKTVVDNLVTEKIVQDEIDRMGIKISKDEVDKKIDTIKAGIPAGQDLNKLLADRGMTMADVEKQLKLQLGVEKAVADKTKISDEEVSKFLNENAQSLSATTEAGKKEEATLALQQQKVQSAITSWVGELRAKAKVWYSDSSLKSL